MRYFKMLSMVLFSVRELVERALDICWTPLHLKNFCQKCWFMNKLAPLPTSPSEFIFDFKSTPNFAFQTCAHFSTPFKTYFWGNLPLAIENKWCKSDQKLEEKEAKQEALEKKWTWKPAQETIISCYIMQKRKCAKYKDIKPVQTSINKSLVEASFRVEHCTRT